MSRLILLIALLASLAGVAAASEPAPPDFSGRWSLDKAASGSMEPLLQLQDVSWLLRKLAAGLDSEVTIQQTATGMTLEFDNMLGRTTQRLIFDGQPHPTKNPAGGAATLTATWVEGGAALLTTGPVAVDEGQEGVLAERRRLSADGETMVLDVEMTVPSGASASVRRVWTKQRGGGE